LQQAAEVVGIHTAYIVKQRCRHYKAVPNVVRISQQVKSAREPSFRQSRHIYEHSNDVARRHEEEVNDRSPEIAKSLGPNLALHKEEQIHHWNPAHQSQSQENQASESAVLGLLEAFGEGKCEDADRAQTDPCQEENDEVCVKCTCAAEENVVNHRVVGARYKQRRACVVQATGQSVHLGGMCIEEVVKGAAAQTDQYRGDKDENRP